MHELQPESCHCLCVTWRKVGAALVRRQILSVPEAAMPPVWERSGTRVCVQAHTPPVVDFVSFGRYQRKAPAARAVTQRVRGLHAAEILCTVLETNTVQG